MNLDLLTDTPSMFRVVFSTGIFNILISLVFHGPRKNNMDFPAFKFSPDIEEKPLIVSIKVYI